MPMMTLFDVDAWPIIDWPGRHIHQLSLLHLDTRLDRHARPGAPAAAASGRAVWGGISADGWIGLSWQWVRIELGVVALLDPMDIRSNLRFLGAAGEPLDATARCLLNNRIVAALPWQAAAMDCVRGGTVERSVALHPPRPAYLS